MPRITIADLFDCVTSVAPKGNGQNSMSVALSLFGSSFVIAVIATLMLLLVKMFVVDAMMMSSTIKMRSAISNELRN